MANNYIMFSEMISELTATEMAWIAERLDEHVQAQDESADGYEDDARVMDFDCAFEPDGFWVYSEEVGNVDCVCDFVQKFLAKFRPDKVWYLNYAWTCSKPRVGEFGGGKAKVTAKGWNACCGDCVDSDV